ncbi:hypothetical protein V1519DRAFT_463830 [Lipomyces tetrasporus]
MANSPAAAGSSASLPSRPYSKPTTYIDFLNPLLWMLFTNLAFSFGPSIVQASDADAETQVVILSFGGVAICIQQDVRSCYAAYIGLFGPLFFSGLTLFTLAKFMVWSLSLGLFFGICLAFGLSKSESRNKMDDRDIGRLGGPDSSLITNDWLQQNIRVGTLGEHYPNFTSIMEGDTPSFFPLMPNGLAVPEHPQYGGWGGRFKPLDASRRANTFTDATDWVRASGGVAKPSVRLCRPHAVDRLRRLPGQQPPCRRHHQWHLWTDFQLAFRSGSIIVLDASDSWDPDANEELTFDWMYYPDVNIRLQGNIRVVNEYVKIEKLNDNGSVVRVTPKREIASLTSPFFSLSSSFLFLPFQNFFLFLL